jgi:PAS domain S-box-containing protein
MVGSLKEQVDRLGVVTREAEMLREEIRRFETVKEAQYLCELRFRLMADCMTDYAVCTLDATGAVKNWNTGAERLLGYSSSEIVDQSYSRFFTKEDLLARHPERLLDQARFSGRAGQEGWRVRKGGGRIRSRSSIIPLKSSLGAPSGYLLVIHDLTRIEEANLATLKAQAELEGIRKRLSSIADSPDTPA